MYSKAVLYRGIYLAPASTGMKLYEEKKFKELDALLKQILATEKELENR